MVLSYAVFQTQIISGLQAPPAARVWRFRSRLFGLGAKARPARPTGFGLDYS